MFFAANEFCRPRPDERVFTATVRYRTVGDASLTAAVRSDADTVEEIIEEVASTTVVEPGDTVMVNAFGHLVMTLGGI